MATVRLDVKTEQMLAYDGLQPFIGVADSGGRQLSERTGEKLRELLEEKRLARRSG
jgi:hypothetical protein